MLTLKVIQAKYGDCLLLAYGEEVKPSYMLIDGGPAGTYQNHLKAELEKVKAKGGKLDLLVLSHVDGDHIVGLLDLTEAIRENAADGDEPLIEIKELWMNSFSQSVAKGTNLKVALQHMLANVNNLASTMPSGNKALLSILQGDTLRRNALLLDIPTNRITDNEIISYETVKDPVQIENLRIHIIGPNEENLRKLQKEWQEWIRKNESRIMTTDQELLSSIDKSVPNLSSIMFLLEAEGKKILFTGDGRGDFIIEGLQKAELLDHQGSIHVDVFKVPHHGSIRNATQDFFEKVTADIYIISADGRHHNPDYETLSWIVSSAKKQGRKISLICTNSTDSTEKLKTTFPPIENDYHLVYMEQGTDSLDIDL